MKTVHVSHTFAEDVLTLKESYLCTIMNESNLDSLEKRLTYLLDQYGIRFTDIKVEPKYEEQSLGIKVFDKDREIKFLVGYMDYVNEQMKHFRGTKVQREEYYYQLMNYVDDSSFHLDL